MRMLLTIVASSTMLLGLLPLTGCGGSRAVRTPAPPVADGMIRHADHHMRFTIDYPESWQVVPSPDAHVLVIPYDGDNEAGMSVNVTTEDLPVAQSLESYWEHAERNLAAGFDGYRTLGSVTLKMGGQDALRVDYQATSGGSRIIARTYAILDGKRAYVITAASIPERFARVAGQLSVIAESFHLIP